MMPRSAKPLWLAAALLAAAVFPLLSYGSELFYAEGGESPDAPAMVFVAVFYLTPIWFSAWMGFAALYLIGYRGGGRLRTLASGSVRTALLSFLANAVSAFFVWVIFTPTEWHLASRLPFALWLLACALFAQFLRAAGVERHAQRTADPR